MLSCSKIFVRILSVESSKPRLGVGEQGGTATRLLERVIRRSALSGRALFVTKRGELMKVTWTQGHGRFHSPESRRYGLPESWVSGGTTIRTPGGENHKPSGWWSEGPAQYAREILNHKLNGAKGG